MNMITSTTKLPGVIVIEPVVFGDSRGLFKELFKEPAYIRNGVDISFVQDNFSRSSKDVLRGLHFQIKKPQGKLISVLSGCIFDVAVDIDPCSPSYCQWVGVELSDQNHKQLWVPPGYAHGFCVLSESADVHYKCTALYDPADEGGVYWADKSIGVDWPTQSPVISEKDTQLPTLADYWTSRS